MANTEKEPKKNRKGACAGHRSEFNGGLGQKWYQIGQQFNTIKLNILRLSRIKVKIKCNEKCRLRH